MRGTLFPYLCDDSTRQKLSIFNCFWIGEGAQKLIIITECFMLQQVQFGKRTVSQGYFYSSSPR